MFKKVGMIAAAAAGGVTAEQAAASAAAGLEEADAIDREIREQRQHHQTVPLEGDREL
jgi:hypothetical protein